MDGRLSTRAKSMGIVAAFCLVFGLAGCGGGGGSSSGGSVQQIPGGMVPAGTPALLVGDSANTNAIQLSQTMASCGYKVDFAPSVPTNTNSYAVVVIDESAQISSGSAATVKGLLDQGKGVVLLGRVPAILATGSNTLPANLTPISSWFGGATEMEAATYFQGLSVFTNPLVNLPASLKNNEDIYSETNVDNSSGPPYIPSDKIGPNSAQVLRDIWGGNVWGVAYTPATGGRLYWQWSPYGTNSSDFSDMQSVFAAGTRWAAGFQK